MAPTHSRPALSKDSTHRRLAFDGDKILNVKLSGQDANETEKILIYKRCELAINGSRSSTRLGRKFPGDAELQRKSGPWRLPDLPR